MFNATKKRKCIFCGSKDLSNEHIYPSWLFQIININLTTFKPSNNVVVFESTNVSDKIINSAQFSDNREIRYDQFKVKQVCRQCNSGWMSTLERKIKSIIENLITNQNYQINDTEAYDLSRWSIIKIALIGYASQMEHSFDEFLLEMLKENIIPEGFIVEYRSMETYFINYSIGNIAPLEATRLTKEQIDLANEFFFVAGLQFGKIGIRVSFLRTSISVQRIQINEKLLLLYPFKGKLPYFGVDVPEESVPNSQANELTGLCNSITLCDKLY